MRCRSMERGEEKKIKKNSPNVNICNRGTQFKNELNPSPSAPKVELLIIFGKHGYNNLAWPTGGNLKNKIHKHTPYAHTQSSSYYHMEG